MCSPQKAGEPVRDGDGDFRCRLMFCRQFPETPAQPLLRLVSNRNHTRRLAFASAGERHPNARSVLKMPRDFDEESSDERVAGCA